MSRKVSINLLATGVPGLDAILGGGLPEFSFNLIAGQPGFGAPLSEYAGLLGGKPTLAAPLESGRRR
jgi:hypothetical protein